MEQLSVDEQTGKGGMIPARIYVFILPELRISRLNI